MPIITKFHTKNISKRLLRQTQILLNNNSIPLPEHQSGKVVMTTVFEIQQIKYYSESEIKSSAPEGYRVLLACNGEVIAALDFYFKGERLHFSHAFEGTKLNILVTALNCITKKYQSKRDEFRLSCIEFLHSGQPYFVVFSDAKFQIFTMEHHEIKKISKMQLQSRLSKLKSSLQ